jgi:hypothetical protein
MSLTEEQSQALAYSYSEALKSIAVEQEAYWNSLTKDEQLKVFCAVVRRIVQAELRDKGSYRWALYNVFGFGLESYVQGMECGYMALHNSIYGRDHDHRLLEAFCKKHNIEDSDKKITEFWL